MRGSHFVPDSIDLLYCHLQKIGFEKRRIIYRLYRSYIKMAKK